MSILEVAKLAKCSHATVSRVINRQPGVSEGAATRVMAAMRELGYTPPIKRRGPQPKSQASMRTGNVALLQFGTDASPMVSPVAAIAIHAVEEALGDLGFSLTLGQAKNGSRVPAIVTRGEVDGLILHGEPPSQEMADRLMRYPAVWILSPRGHRGYWGDRVAPDHYAIGRCAADHLIEQGHKRIAFLMVDKSHLGYAERARAFCETAEDAGVSAVTVSDDDLPDNKHCDAQLARKTVYTSIENLAKLADRPTGVFVPKGQTTVMVYEALRKYGIEPGKDVSVIACDNDPTLAGLNPPVATVDVRPARIGRLAVEQLLRRIDKPEPDARTTILVEPGLVLPEEA